MTTDVTQPFAHDENMQAFENEANILIAVADETYGKSDEGEWERDREQFRLALEHEFGGRFEDADIGPGASFPAFLTLVPVAAMIVAAFFRGKAIKDNFDAWRDIGRRIRAYFKRSCFLNRHGASVIAVEAVFDEIGAPPQTFRLLSYRTAGISEPDNLALMSRGSEIAEAPPTLYLGFIRHIFEIEADGVVFRISIDGGQAKLLRLS